MLSGYKSQGVRTCSCVRACAEHAYIHKPTRCLLCACVHSSVPVPVSACPSILCVHACMFACMCLSVPLCVASYLLFPLSCIHSFQTLSCHGWAEDRKEAVREQSDWFHAKVPGHAEVRTLPRDEWSKSSKHDCNAEPEFFAAASDRTLCIENM